MITFLNEKGVEHGALASIKITNAVNGERSLSGEIESGDYVLENIERGWRLRFDDEYYAVTYAKPVDEGTSTHVTFDAVHQFFWDFDKSSVHEQLNDGSHTFVTYLDFIFKDSGYTYTIEPLLKVYAFEKQSFGYKSRLKLFNDIITSSGVEFQVNGKVVRILEKTGTDLSTVVRKNFNMNELGIEKNISDFVTYQKGFGAWVDENDHTKGRLTVEYTSPLASVYGKLEAEPLVDERYTKADSMTAALKENVDNSYSISITLDMEDLTRAGYDYTQPTAGDYIMAINETLGFKEKIRIVSFTSEYDITGQLVKHEVTCNDIGAVKKLSASYTLAKEQAQNASDSIAQAVETANKALVSADGKSTVYFGNEFPKDEPKGTLHKGDSLYLTVGDTTKMYYWTGADWEELPIVNDVEAFKEQIADELKDVPDREEFEATITEKLATSKAELETQIDTAKTQAETNAKAYADEINQATAEVAEQASTAVNSLKSDLAKVQTDLTTVSNTANSAKTSASEAKQQLTTVANDLSTAKQDLQAQASQLTAQASAQSELTKRVSTVEETANGTKTTVSELSKTVDSNTQNITSVTARTKTVEDDLTSTKTTLSQVKTTANSANQKTATLETGLNGLNAKFETLKIGSRNYFKNSKSRKYYINSTEIQDVRTYIDDDFWQNDTRFTKNYVRMSFDIAFNPALPSNFKTYVHFSASPWYNSGGITFKGGTTALQHFDLKFDLSGAGNSYKTDNVFIRLNNTLPLNTAVSLENFNLYLSAVVEDYNQNEADIESKVAKYKQTADQNYASLQSNLQTLDGTVKQNKSEFDQTASQLKTSISAVEGKIPTTIGGRNLVRGTANFSSGWAWNTKVATITDIIDKFNVYHGTSTGTDTASNNYDVRFDNALTVLPDTEYTLSFWVKGSGTIYSHFFPSCVAYGINSDGKTTTAADGFITHTLKSNWERYWITWKTLPTANGLKNVLPCRQVSTAKSEVWLYGVKLEKGNITTDWTPAPEDYDSKLATAQSEIKQTTDSIKASVSALDKSTVKSASLTINTDGIVMKAGKSTTDVANAIGSYFAVNQNAINLFSDKINVKGSMIVDGAITSTKIASKSINTAHLNGKIITADVISTGAITANAIKAGAVTTSAMSANSINGDRITAGTLDAAKIKAGSITASQIASGTITSAQIKTGTISAANIAAGAITTDKIAANSINSSKIVSSGITANVIKGGKLQSLSNATNFELDTGKLFYNNNNTGIFRVQANASTMGLKFSNTSITVSGTSRILSRVILGGDRRETTLDDGKWDQGGFSGIVVETINGIAANDHERADSLRVIADNIYFGHSYNKDVVTNTSAAGWKMETFSPNSTYTGHVVMKPFGINSRYADIVTGDVRLDNGDGSGYWVRGCIQVLRNCFQHFLNGGTSNDAKNAIRNALKDISGV